MQKVTTAWLIYEMTGSKAWLGADAFASGITTVLLLPIGGVLADRIDRRRLLIVTNIACAILAFALALLASTSSLRVWHIITFSALSGVVQAMMIPATTSLLPALVGKEDVPNAIALNSFQFNLSRAIGPVIGGAALVYLGAASSFALNGLSFLVLVAAFVLIRRVPPIPQSTLGWGQSVAEGVRFVRGRPDLIRLLGLVAITALLGAPVISLLPALTADVLKREAASYSLLLTCFGIGAIIAAIASAMLGKHRARSFAIALLVAAIGVAQSALAFSTWTVATVLVALAGVAFVGTMIQLGTTILLDTEDAYRGRVTSLQQMCFRIGQPLGAFIGGIIADQTGIGFVFGLFGGLLIVTAIGALLPVKIRKLRNSLANQSGSR